MCLSSLIFALFFHKDYFYFADGGCRPIRPGACVDIIREGFCAGSRGLTRLKNNRDIPAGDVVDCTVGAHEAEYRKPEIHSAIDAGLNPAGGYTGNLRAAGNTADSYFAGGDFNLLCFVVGGGIQSGAFREFYLGVIYRFLFHNHSSRPGIQPHVLSLPGTRPRKTLTS